MSPDVEPHVPTLDCGLKSAPNVLNCGFEVIQRRWVIRFGIEPELPKAIEGLDRKAAETTDAI
jgi:hypothetical protein